MFDGCSEGIRGEVNSSNVGVVAQGIDDRLDRKSGGRCLSDRRHEEDGLDGLFKFLGSEGMVRGDGRVLAMMPRENGEFLTCAQACANSTLSGRNITVIG